MCDKCGPHSDCWGGLDHHLGNVFGLIVIGLFLALVVWALTSACQTVPS